MNQELHNAANEYCLKYQLSHGFDTDDIDIYDSFVSGTEWQKQRLIDKACEWLFEYNKHQARKFGAKSIMRLPDYTINVGKFRKAMEDEE